MDPNPTEVSYRRTTSRSVAAPPPDWQNLAFWCFVVAGVLNLVSTSPVVPKEAAAWFALAIGVVNFLQYAFSRGYIRGTR